jgi:hypothetical protein
MSRYTITVTRTASRHSDPDATIGYDRPLQTFFRPGISGQFRWRESRTVAWHGLSGEFETLSQPCGPAVNRTRFRLRAAWHPAFFTGCWTTMPGEAQSGTVSDMTVQDLAQQW